MQAYLSGCASLFFYNCTRWRMTRKYLTQDEVYRLMD
ncbi:DNA recombinase, partial [Escherichia coli]